MATRKEEYMEEEIQNFANFKKDWNDIDDQLWKLQQRVKMVTDQINRIRDQYARAVNNTYSQINAAAYTETPYIDTPRLYESEFYHLKDILKVVEVEMRNFRREFKLKK